jgi:mRNA-degrading endonuclease RelE of RelBE toxin-antitoxin system
MSVYKYEFTKNFERKSSKLFQKDNSMRKRFYKTLKKVLNDPFYKGLRTYKVNTSNSSRITGDIRVLWDFSENKLKILIIDIGGHEGSKAVY